MQYHAHHGVNEPSARILSLAQVTGQATRANWRLIGAFVGGAMIEGKANGQSRFKKALTIAALPSVRIFAFGKGEVSPSA